MNENQNGNPAVGLSRDDILFVLFRHKWKITIISSIALIAAALVYRLMPVPYRSEATLLIKYVVDTRNPGQMGSANSSVSRPDDRGDTVLNTELEVLGSFDIAMEVARSVGPSNILGQAGGDLATAAGVIRKDLILDVPKRSSVIHLIFQHENQNVVQPVLNSLIQEYYKKHLAIHRDVGQFGDFLTTQTDVLHSRLLQTEEALRAAKTNAGVISVEDTKKVYGQQIAHIQDQILESEAELAERQAAAIEMAKLTHSQMQVSTNDAAATNDVPVPSDKLAEYTRISKLLDRLSTRQQELLVQFTPENSWVKQLEEQINANEKIKEKLEEAYPSLATTRIALPRGNDARSNAQAELASELARVSGLQSKIKILAQQLDEIQRAAAKMYASEASISDLQRKYYLQETQYNYFSMSLEQSRIDDALGANRSSNISQIQAPTPPGRDTSKLRKTALGILAVGFAFAIGLAFLIEFYLDRSIKRPVDIENRLHLPLFISIPRLNLAKPRANLHGGKAPLLVESTAQTKTNGEHSKGTETPKANVPQVPATIPTNGQQLAPWDPRYILRPFCQALRDNLITYFEVNNLTHKPKLVAVTSCSEGAGVSTIAAGLAASLSETGEGNVLLVNMNQSNGAVQQFYKGKLACDLDDALESGTRDQALVQHNLYVANEVPDGDSLPVILPKRFKSLVPKLRASDYDYIIFDMPEVSQMNPTQRLARFMDMVLMVVESEKTDRDAAKRVGSLLVDSKTNVGVILNKTRNHLPRLLRQGA